MLILHPLCLTKMYAKYELRTVINCVTLITDSVNQCQKQFCDVLCKSFPSDLYIIFNIFWVIVLLHTNVFQIKCTIYSFNASSRFGRETQPPSGSYST